MLRVTPRAARRAAAALAQPVVQKVLKKRMASELVRRWGMKLYSGAARSFLTKR